MQAFHPAGTLAGAPADVARRVERGAVVRAARPRPRSQRFAAVVERRSHELSVLALAVLLVGVLLGVGVWVTLEVARGVAIADYCDGACVVVPR